MRTKLWVGSAAVFLILAASGCATPPAEVTAFSTRHPQYGSVVKRVVVVLGSMGALDARAVRSQLTDLFKSNDVNALVLFHNPVLPSQNPILDNQAAVRALRPHAVLHFYARQVMSSFHGGVRTTYFALLTLPNGPKVWEASFTMLGTEQGESILAAELTKKLIQDRIIDKNTVVPDEVPGARQI
jgi:hypothetical protein